MKKISLPNGARFGHWTVIRWAKRIGHSSYHLCRCTCLREVEVATYTLLNGASTRCRQCSGVFTRTHGEYKSPEHRAWTNMFMRAGKRKHYVHVCISDEWKGPQGFSDFLKHIGRKPTPTHELDRINRLGHYAPGNVQWSTRKEQMRNTSKNVLLTIDGKTKCMAAWADESGIAYDTIQRRITLGWEPKRAVFQAVKNESEHRMSSTQAAPVK